MISVVVVEDSDTIREGLRILIDETEGYACLGAYSNCEAMLLDIKKLSPNVLLMDIGLPGMNGIDGIKEVKSIFSEITILVLTVYEENELIFEALCAGASGYLVKKTPPSKLLEAIQEAFMGGSPMSSHIARNVIELFKKKKQPSSPNNDAQLTGREKEILIKLVDGHSFKSIADSLFISIETVRFHFRNIYKKLHVHTQYEAVAKAIKERIV